MRTIHQQAHTSNSGERGEGPNYLHEGEEVVDLTTQGGSDLRAADGGEVRGLGLRAI